MLKKQGRLSNLTQRGQFISMGDFLNLQPHIITRSKLQFMKSWNNMRLPDLLQQRSWYGLWPLPFWPFQSSSCTDFARRCSAKSQRSLLVIPMVIMRVARGSGVIQTNKFSTLIPVRFCGMSQAEMRLCRRCWSLWYTLHQWSCRKFLRCYVVSMLWIDSFSVKKCPRT